MYFSLIPTGRPQTVTWFEWLSTLVVIAELISFGSGWLDLAWALLILWIIISISRRRSSIARWIFTAIYVLGYFKGAYDLAADNFGLADIASEEWALAVATIVQLWLVWSPGTSRWLASRLEVESERPA